MKLPDFHKVDQWITKILSRPGIDEGALAQRKIYWIASVAVTSMVLCLTIAYHIIFPQLRILIYYGLFLTAVFLQGVIYPLIFHHTGVWRLFIDQSLVAIATFICILKVGGIPYSGGLIFVGLALVFFSLNFRKKRHSISIFIIYIITVILAGVLNPYLTVPPEMTPSVNISLFVINLLWISGFAVVFVMNFISQSVKLEQLETNRLKELDEAKTKLYTNITHEFRTPLTIITGMTDLMRKDPGKWLEEGSEKIDRNAGLLLNLVNQMLDLTKIEAGAMPIKMIRADINMYIRYIVELFRSVAATARIALNYTFAEQQLVIDYDPYKLMQIITNLLSNALKFTQPGGRVEVCSSLTGDGRFEIRVSDDGPGIPEDYLPQIFDRFSRGETNYTYTTPGSGLGLSLTKELVKLLNGTITVESVFGEGTEFIITLAVTYNAPLHEGSGPQDFDNNILRYIFHPGSREAEVKAIRHSYDEKPLLLVVEDNDDVAQYLMTLLAKDYDVIIAVNGEDGVTKSIEYMPDIIISDIMMPVMDGIEMLKSVKNDFRTSHIPVVILTARADIGSRLEGLERGADAYIAKPFLKEELLVQIRSLIQLRKKLQERYASATHLHLTEDIDFHIEDAFMQRIHNISMVNLSDESFHIDRLCREMAMSRTQLYRKFRSLTDKTIAEYFRSLRLHKAKELLTNSELSVSEAAYKTGFKNVSHFSRVFTQEFGINPREIRK